MEFTRIEGANFNPMPQKVPMRYSFSLEQKRILMKHYENGMSGQSLAYQDKIVACAREAGVDFDIVRNWIGNMRRKRRMESAQKFPMSSAALEYDQSAENKRCLMVPSGPFSGPQCVMRPPINGAQQPQPTNSVLRSSSTGLNVPMATSTIKNLPLAPRDQNVAVPASGQLDSGHPTAPILQPTFAPIPTKQESESEQKTTCLVTANNASQPNQGTFNTDRFPEETTPFIRDQSSGSGLETEEFEWRQQQIQRIMQQVQQSVHQLENLGCECVVATVMPSDGGTYITGTPVAVQYFSEIQKVQPMADYVNPNSPLSVMSDGIQNDATEETNKPADNQRSQCRLGTSDKKDSHNCSNSLGESVDEGAGDREENVQDLERKDEGVIRAGEEVYIVNKEHYVIGTGTLLPAPHRRIELKNPSL